MAASHFLTGTHHCAILDSKEHGATHRQFNECTLHPGHEKFMTVDECLNKKPSEIGLYDREMPHFRNQIARTIRVVVYHTSDDRPDTFINSENPYPCKDIRGNYCKTRYGTGCLLRRCNVGEDDNGNDDENNDNGIVDDHNDDDDNNNGDDDDDDNDDNNDNGDCDDADDDDDDDDDDTGNDNTDEDYDNGNNDDDKDNNNDADNNDDIDNGDGHTDDNDNGNDDNNDVPFFVKVPCPCLECKTSTCQTSNRKSYYFLISTATHVIFDEQEAQRAKFELFYDSEDRSNVVMLYGITVLGTRHLRWQTDCCRVVCVTHDGSLAEKLGHLCEENDYLWMNNVLVSHPHSVSKRISVGDGPDKIIVVIPNKKSVQLKKGTEIRFPDCHGYTRIIEDINRLLDKRVIGRKLPSNTLALDCDLTVFRPESVVMETDWYDYFEYKDGKRIRKNKVWCNVFHPGTQLETDGGKRYTFPYNDDKVPGINMEVFVETKDFIDKKDKDNRSVFLYQRYNMASCPGSSGARVGPYGHYSVRGPPGHVHFGNCGDFNTSSLVWIHTPDGDELEYKIMHMIGAEWYGYKSAYRRWHYDRITGI